MTIGNSNQAYALEWDDAHLSDADVDAWLVKFPDWENTIRLSSTGEYKLPERVEFDALFQTLHATDFPVNDVRWSIMSKRMLNTLSAVGDFANRAISVVMVDCEVIPHGQGLAKRSEKEDHSFVAVQILEHLEALDWEKSIYEPSFILPEQVMGIRSLVLKESEKPLPPLFRLSAYPTALFVSAEPRSALEQKGIKGVTFRELVDFRC